MNYAHPQRLSQQAKSSQFSSIYIQPIEDIMKVHSKISKLFLVAVPLVSGASLRGGKEAETQRKLANQVCDI